MTGLKREQRWEAKANTIQRLSKDAAPQEGVLKKTAFPGTSVPPSGMTGGQGGDRRCQNNTGQGKVPSVSKNMPVLRGGASQRNACLLLRKQI